MTKEKVQEYYEILKFYYLKTDSDWTDKAKSIRTVAHNFYNEITKTDGTFAEALKEFYKWNKYNEVSKAAFVLKDKLNDIVHHNLKVDKATYILYYDMLVRLIYLATEVLPDQSTMEFIGPEHSDELKGLTDEQKDAVLCDAKIIYVSAGPGTGKTYLLVNKLIHYIRTSRTPEKIVALSYTNTAANELGERFHVAAYENGITQPYEFYNGTLHSFCFKMMKVYYTNIGEDFNYIIIDDTDIEDLADEFRIQFNDKYTKDDITTCLKSRLRSNNPQLQQLITEMKSRYKIITIDDILNYFINILEDKGFRQWIKDQISVLVIDEAQDLTELNYKIFDLLLQNNPSLKMFLVGDSRQNIFSFNGGSYKHLDDFLNRHNNYVRKNLTGTHRCPQPVCNYVNTFRFLDCDNTPLRNISGNIGEIHVNEYDDVDSESREVLGIVQHIGDLKNTAVLFRRFKYMQTFIHILSQASIPYKVFGGQLIVKKHIRIFNHFLRIIDTDNIYSINAVGRAYWLQLDRVPGRNVTERFYHTNVGLFLKDIKADIERHKQFQEDIPLKNIASTLIDHFFNETDPAIRMDLHALEEMTINYKDIADFLLSFAINRESFSRFYEKNYVECKVPVTDKYLTVSTIHSAKGMEWKNVIVMGLSEGNFPNMWFARDMDKNEKETYLNDERKLMFVAATRTEKDLYLTYAKKNPWGYPQMRSRFLGELR